MKYVYLTIGVLFAVGGTIGNSVPAVLAGFTFVYLAINQYPEF